MQQHLKKYFWAVNVIAVAICAVFAARATMHYLEARLLTDAAEPAKPATPSVRKRAQPTAVRSKSGKLLAERNMFCSECSPPEPEQVDDGPVGDPDSPTPTSLPLSLIATNVSKDPSVSFATIHNTETDHLGAYGLDDAIPEAGPVVKITAKYVDFRNGRRLERVSLADEPRTPKRREPTRPARTAKRDEVSDELDEGIKKIDDENYELDRGMVEKIIANPAAIRGARIVPSIKNGKPNGFKLYAIRPSSAFAKIGLQNGDTIHAINGYDLTTPDKALEVYTKVREANSISVSITRRGKPVTINYSIR